MSWARKNFKESEDPKATSAATKLDISEPAEFYCRFDSRSFLSLPVSVKYANTQTQHNFKDGEMNRGAGAEKDKPQIPPLQSAEVEAKSSIQPQQSGIRKAPEPITAHPSSNSEQKKTTRFEAMAVEAELGMHLDLFSEAGVSAPKSSSFGSVASESGQSLDVASSRDKPVTPIDDSIDDLLTETSICLNDQKPPAPQQKEALFCGNLPLGLKSTNVYNLPSGEAMPDSMTQSMTCLR